MVKTALITGAPAEVAAVSRAAARLGVDVLGVHDIEGFSEVCTRLSIDAVDCYIQLPMPVDTGAGRGVVDRAGEFLAGGLLTRFQLAVTAVPTLRAGATVTLVAGHEAEPGLPDDAAARLDLLGVLARAVAADTAGRGARVNVIAAGVPPEEIAEIALRQRTRLVATTDYAGLVPDGTYDDWRREALSHVSHD